MVSWFEVMYVEVLANHSSFISIKHLHEIPTGSHPAVALTTGGV